MENVQHGRVPPPKPQDSDALGLFGWVDCLVSALMCGILIFVFVGKVITVEGSSMVPTLHNEDKVVISELFYTPQPGDVVVLQTDSYSTSDALVKRIIAVEGQTVDIDFDAGIVYVDGTALDEPYIAEDTHVQINFEGPMVVPEGCVFVMGDNRNHSTDSRDSRIGMVDSRCILGKVYFILFPTREADGKRDWSRWGSLYG